MFSIFLSYSKHSQKFFLSTRKDSKTAKAIQFGQRRIESHFDKLGHLMDIE